MTSPPTFEPRPGLLGTWDRLAGPGATLAENLLNLIWSGGFAAFVAGYACQQGLGWTWLQWIVAILFALDLAGGVTMNAAPAARRWWHRPGQGARQHLAFAAIHVHPFVLALAFPAVGWRFACETYGYLLLATVIVLLSPRRLRRPIAYAFFATALLLCLLRWPVAPGLAWFAPFYFQKLLLAHLLDDGARETVETAHGRS